MQVPETLMMLAIRAAVKAGEAIMKVYEGDFNIEYKPDASPLTLADKNAHQIISEHLSGTGIPLISEEGFIPEYEIRKEWSQFWLIDPLDGTKEFIHRNGDFTVNIALIDNQVPIFGVIYVPVHQTLYWGSSSGSFRHECAIGIKKSDIYSILEKKAMRLHGSNSKGNFRVAVSRSHLNQATKDYISELRKNHQYLTLVEKGSSLKFCMVAEGSADLYPRFGPTMEWDTAAGHAIALFAGCEIYRAENKMPVIYNKPILLNPYFIVSNKKKR